MRDLMNRMDEWDLGDLFDGLFEPVRFERMPRAMQMKTDIKEDENAYELDIDLPGFEKDEINVTIKNGYLNVSAKKIENAQHNAQNHHAEEHKESCECGCHDKKDECECDDNCECGCQENGHARFEHKKPYIRRERSMFASRSFYVGDKVMEEDIKAKYNNGVLSLIVPKQKPKELTSHKINID